MRLTQDLALEQRQQLIMTPRLQQAIKLLQLSTYELHQSLEEELMVNPVLEISANGEEDMEPKEKGRDLEWEEYLANSNYTFQGASDGQKRERSFEEFFSQPESLNEHLLQQLRLLVSNQEEISVGEYIIGNLDENGFLTMGKEELIQQLKVDLLVVEKVLAMVQSLDPLGIGALDLKSSLLLQLEQLNMDTSLATKIIKGSFGALKDYRIRDIAKALNVSLQEVQKALDLISSLNPRPAAKYYQGKGVPYLEADLLVKEIEGRYYIICNDLGPSLRISPYYRQLLKEMDHKKARKYLKDRLDSALWLIKAIEQRRLTVYRTMEAIVEFQLPFFRQGIKYLYPLTMQEVADRIGVHESTVSRATTNKYVQTVHGLYEMKFFFSSGIQGQGRDLSSTSIRSMIQDLIKGEDTTSPFSDKKIALLLEDKGIHLSRRTVAKYRQQLKIPSSSMRRRYE